MKINNLVEQIRHRKRGSIVFRNVGAMLSSWKREKVKGEHSIAPENIPPHGENQKTGGIRRYG